MNTGTTLEGVVITGSGGKWGGVRDECNGAGWELYLATLNPFLRAICADYNFLQGLGPIADLGRGVAGWTNHWCKGAKGSGCTDRNLKSRA